MEQHNNKEGIDELMEIARLRFGMIAPVIQEMYPDESIMAYCRRVIRLRSSTRHLLWTAGEESHSHFLRSQP